MVVSMNMQLKLGGAAEKIMQGAVKYGLAKTKTNAILLGLVMLDQKYKILEQMEDEEDLQAVRRIEQEIKKGKQKLYTQEEFEKMTGIKISKKKGKKK